METAGIRRFASEKTLFYLTAVIMLLMPVSELITDVACNFTWTIEPSFFQAFILGVYGLLGTFVLVICRGAELTDKSEGKKWFVSDVFYLILLFFMVVSAVFSTAPGVYNNGYVICSEMPVHFLAYFFLFFSGSRIKSSGYRIKLVFILLLIAALQSVVAFFQTFDIEIAYCPLNRHSGAAYGLTQGSNIYGGLSVFLLAASSGAYLFFEKLSAKKALRFILPVFSGFLFYTVLGSRARLIWFGFVPMLLFFAVSGIVMLKGSVSRTVLKRYFIRLAVLAAVFAAVFAITHLFTDYVSEEFQRTQWEIEGKLNNGIGSDRLRIWKYGIKSIPHHWATGIGLDNYRQVFIEDPLYAEGDFIMDKAHNEYLQVLVTQGVFAFIAYMVLLIRTAVINVKKIFDGGDETSQALNWIFLGMFITYACQAFFNISMVNVAMYFWLVLGLLNTCGSPLISSLNKKK